MRHARPGGRWRRLIWPGVTVLVISIAAAVVAVVANDGSTRAEPGDPVAGAASARGTPPSSAAAPTPSRVTPTRTAKPTPAPAAPARFTTQKPGARLPSGAQCATWVKSRPYKENKGVNKVPNKKTGHHVGGSFFSGDDAKANATIAPRVDGQFTGTTGQVLRWAACKWGIDEDIVFAQAAIESWWRQDTLGDFGTDASRCAPGRGLGKDGKDGQCPESFGILQNRYPYEQSAWPGIANSTAMNADLAYAIWRTCYEGYEGWLNTVERGRDYKAGDAWGCIGRWFSGRWHTQPGEDYVKRVRDYLDQRIWETPNFQEP
jgi:autotransporter family porin